MSDGTLVSVVVPTHGRPAFLHEAVDSVLAQTYEPLELVVVDGDPDAATRDALDAQVDDAVPLRYLEQTETTGAGAARNLGIEAARGEFVAFLDDDDRWKPEKLDRQVAAVDGPAVGAVYTGMTYATDERGDGAAPDVERDDFAPDIEGAVTRELLCGNFLGSFSRVLVRASAIEAAGPVDERFPTWEDWEWFVRLSRVCAFRAVPGRLVVRRGGHGDQLSHDVETTFRTSYPRFLEEMRPVAATFGPAFERRFVASVNFRLGWAALMRGRYDVARVTLARALWTDPSPRYLVTLALALGGRPLQAIYARVPDGLTARAGRLLRRWR